MIPKDCPKVYNITHIVCADECRTECPYRAVIVHEKWYDSLLEECREIVVEHEFASRWALIEGYHKLGVRILEDNNNFDRAKIYGDKVVEKLSHDLRISDRTIRRSINFVKRYPKLDMLTDGKNVSWSKIVKQIETKPLESVTEWETCPTCKGKGKIKK
jgi:hypothetical protein